MRPDSYTALAYVCVDKVVRAIERWAAVEIKPSCNYEKSAISQRIAQVIARRLVHPFLKDSIKNYPAGRTCFVEPPQMLRCGGLAINTATGLPSPNIKLFLSSVASFIALWFFVLGLFARSLASKQGGTGPATLVHGVPDADLKAGGSDERFVDFCQNGPLDVLAKANKLIVQAVGPVVATNPQKFVYARFPLLALFSANRLSAKESLGFLKQHFFVFFCYLYLILRNPVACLLWRDISVHAVATAMNRKNLIETNIITNMNWLQQYLWMSDLPNRHFKTYMALYSLNSSAPLFKDDPVAAVHPGIRHLKADLIWIWDGSYEQVLNRDGVFCETQVVSPILWYLPKATPAQRNDAVHRLCVFDVSPVTKEALLSWGMLGNYYSAETMKSYLDDVLAAVHEVTRQFGCKVEIVLKHKRAPTSSHDRSYFNYVNELCDSHSHLRLAKEDANLFSLISECDLVVVIPYSSPAYVANYLGVPALYYDPTNEILPINGDTPLIGFIGGRENLIKAMVNFFTLNGESRKTNFSHAMRPLPQRAER